MTRKEKGLLMVGAGLFLLGAALLAVCTITGGFSGMQYRNPWSWLHHFSSSGSGVQKRQELSGSEDNFGDGDPLYEEINKAFANGEIKDLVIETDACSIYVSADEEFQGYGGDFSHQVSLDGGTLVLIANTADGQGRLDVTVPEGYVFDQASVESGAGEVVLEDIFAENLYVNIGAGTGDLTVKGVEYGEINTGIGECTLSLDGAKEDYNYELTCGIGSLVIDGDSYAGVGQTRQIDNGRERDIYVNNGIGSTVLVFED